jgi:hypothetical protein
MNIRDIFPSYLVLRRVCRYQRGNQNPSIEGHTTQWSKEKGQKDNQRYTKHTHKTKDRVTRTLIMFKKPQLLRRWKVGNILRELDQIAPIDLKLNRRRHSHDCLE